MFVKCAFSVPLTGFLGALVLLSEFVSGFSEVLKLFLAWRVQFRSIGPRIKQESLNFRPCSLKPESTQKSRKSYIRDGYGLGFRVFGFWRSSMLTGPIVKTVVTPTKTP